MRSASEWEKAEKRKEKKRKTPPFWGVGRTRNHLLLINYLINKSQRQFLRIPSISIRIIVSSFFHFLSYFLFVSWENPKSPKKKHKKEKENAEFPEMESASELVAFPLLITPIESNYRACTIPYRFPSDNPRKPTPSEIAWIDLFLNSIPSFKYFFFFSNFPFNFTSSFYLFILISFKETVLIFHFCWHFIAKSLAWIRRVWDFGYL